MSDEIYFSSEKEEQIRNCFKEKLKLFEKEHSEILKEKNMKVDSLYFLFNSGNFIKYKLRDSIKLFDTDFQKETELFFNLALKGCLDKFS